MSETNTPTKALLSAFEQAQEVDSQAPTSSGVFKVSRAVSAAAFWYEKLRTAMEYRDEHLLRRSAIQRILTRRLFQTKDTDELANFLLKELIWARYLQANKVHEVDIVNVSKIIKEYVPVIGKVINPMMRNWLIAIFSSQLEKTIAHSYWIRQEALANFAFYFLDLDLEIKGTITPVLARVQLYIAIWRAYVHADEELIAYQLIKQRFPDWETNLAKYQDQFEQIKSEIDSDLHNNISERLQRFVERNTPPFLVVRDIFEDYAGQEASIIEDPTKLEDAVNQICQKRYLSTHDRVRRAIVRSILYIFLTKMVFAYLLEVPLDRLVSGSVSYSTLAINSIFPPALMFALSISIQIPDQSNTKRILGLLRKILYDGITDLPKTQMYIDVKPKKPFLNSIFKLLYLVAFVVSFGLIYWLLKQLHFTLLSMAVFVFFVTIVSFFAYRIRRTAHQYLFEEKEGLFAPVSDFFWVPILRVGRIFSKGLAQINLLLFLFDLAIEAPFKVIFDLTEEWSTFIRSKKEEI